MATIVIPGTDRLTVDAAQAAKHYGVEVAVCPPRRAQRKGVVEAAIKYMTRSWWRSARSPRSAEAQAIAGPLVRRGRRPRAAAAAATVAELGAAEPLRALPAAAYPALIAVERKASRSALVAFEGNRYSVAARPRPAARVTVHARVGEPHPADRLRRRASCVATHRRAPAGAGQTVRSRRARRGARAGRAGRVHDRARLPAQGQPAARRRRAGRARPPAAASTAAPAPAIDLEPLRRSSPRSRPDGRHHLPAAARAPRTTCASPPSPSSSRPRSSRPSATSPATPSSCTTCSPTRSHAAEQRRLQGRLRLRQASRRARRSSSSTSAPNPSLDRRLVEDLATLRFIEEKANVLLIGPPGVGKTMLAIALGHKRRRGRLPRLLHHRRRPRRPHRQGRARGPLGHHHALLERPAAADRRRARLPADARRSRLPPLPSRQPPLRTRLDRPHHQPRHRRLGRRSSTTPPSPPPSSTASCTTPPSSPSTATATACAPTAPPRHPPRRPQRLTGGEFS